MYSSAYAHQFGFSLYGLAFFAAGLAIAVRASAQSRSHVRSRLLALAAFALLHAAFEWLVLADVILGRPPVPYQWRLGLGGLTFLPLFYFGMARGGAYDRRALLIILALAGAWIAGAIVVPGVRLEVIGRLGLGLPAALCAGAAFAFDPSLRPASGTAFWRMVAAFGFVVFGVLQTLSSPGDFFPASVVNVDNFPAVFGVSSFVVRAVVASVIALAVIRLLDGFDRVMRDAATDVVAKQLERERLFNESLLEIAPVFVVTLAGDGRIRSVNRHFEEVTGYRRDEVLGRDWFDLIVPEYERGAARRLFSKATEGAARPLSISPITRRSGEARFIEWRDRLVRDDAGATICLLVGQDVTERLELEKAEKESQLRLRRILDNMFGFAGLFDLDGTFVEVNQVPLQLAGLKREDVIGKRLWEMEWLSRELGERVVARVAAGEAVRLDIAVPFGDGALVVDATFGPLRDDAGRVVQIVGFGVDVTASREAERQLRESERRFEKAQRIGNMGSWQWKVGTDDLLWSDQIYRIFGFLPGEFNASHSAFFERVHPDDRETVKERVRLAVEGRVPYDVEHRIVRPDGEIRTVQEQGEVECDAAGRPVRMLGTVQDVTVLRAAELAARESEATLSGILKISPDGIIVVDACGRITLFSKGAERIFGYEAGEVVGREVECLIPDRFREAHRWHIDAFAGEDTQSRQMRPRGEIVGLRKNGEEFPATASLSRLVTAKGVIFTSILHDISDRKVQDEKIRRLAFTDPLTGLGNRASFRSRLDEGIAAARRHGERIGLMFVDLDRFKAVNDTHGHHVGDELLSEIGRRLVEAARSSDLVSRIGGDEFAIIVSNLPDPTLMHRLAERILAAVSSTIDLPGASLEMGASIGMSVHPEDGDDADTLMIKADVALYQAKDAGRGVARMFDSSLHNKMQAKQALEHDLRAALAADQIEVVVQPQVSLLSGETIGLEALARWPHPQSGMIQPQVFIAAAETTGIIVPLGEAILRKACAFAADWQRRHSPMQIAVNVTARQFRERGFVGSVQDILCETGLKAELLQLELTETMMVDDPEAVAERLHELARLGIKIAIDDFGTGYSSLSYLRRFPVHQVKIDRNFVMSLPHDHDSMAIVTAVIQMAKSMNLSVVAEGVEKAEQAAFLVQHGCLVGQGYLFSPPMALSAFEGWLAADTAARAPRRA